MTDRILPYYQGELAYIRRLLDDFSTGQPDAATRLRLRKHGTDDPHVARLIDAFAYLTARIRLKLDDEFPEITDAILNVLCPHYLAPVPSAAIVQFALDSSKSALTTGYKVAKGAELEISDPQVPACRYRTCYDTTLWPIEIAACELQRRPFAAPNVPQAREAVALAHFVLRCSGKTMTFSKFQGLDFLRFFLFGDEHNTMPFYELLLNHCLQIAVATSPGDTTPLALSPDHLRPVGFHPNDNLLPYDARSFPGYGLLTDYFAFPHKFLFVDLYGVGNHPRGDSGQMEVFFFLNRYVPELEQYVKDIPRLGCTPIVNLFSKRAEPVKLTHKAVEYPVVPDARQPKEIEVYSVDRVTTSSDHGDTVEYLPLYAFRHGQTGGAAPAYWQSHRRGSRDNAGRPAKGTDVFLSLVDLDFNPGAPADNTLIVETTCFNRDLPGDISRPQAGLTEGAPIKAELSCLVGPTPTTRPGRRHHHAWSLISHLTLGHLSISDMVGQVEDGRGAEALRRILELYDFGQSPANQKRIAGLAGIHSRPKVSRLPVAPSGFSRGIEITVDFDEDQFRDPGQGLYLFASVLENFFAMYCSINSFSKMTARIKQGERVIKRWPPNAGDRYLL